MALLYDCAMADPAENCIARVATLEYSFASTTQGRVLLGAQGDLVGLRSEPSFVELHTKLVVV